MTQEQRAALHAAPLDDLRRIYAAVWSDNDREIIRDFILNDRFFLLTQVLGVEVAFHPWVLERCREVEAEPDERLDLWSRGHFKSTIITFAGVAQFVLANPEKCVCIISYKAGAAEAFAAQIKNAFETNEVLLECFPDVLWADVPDHRGPQWSVSDFSVRRKTAKKECTVATSGLVSGMRTGGHYDLLVYDDTVTPDSVVTPEMSQRTTDAWTMSLNLGSDGAEGSERTRHWYIGTRYAVFDTYAAMIERGIRERRHVAVDADGNPVYLSRAALDQKRREMDAKTWASQIMQQPIGSGELVFRTEWLAYYDRPPAREAMNVYVFVDGANSKKQSADFTTMWTVGYAADGNHYVLGLVHDRLSLSERTAALFGIVRKWRPNMVFWEQVGAMSDVAHVRDVQDRESWHFPITPLNHRQPKDNRIRSLEPLFRNGRIWLPRVLRMPHADGSVHDEIADFVEHEYAVYPSVRHDDLLDPLADLNDDAVRAVASFPMPNEGTVADPYRANTAWKPF